MYYTVGSQCPKIPIPDRVAIAELFSSEWLLLNLNSFSQDLPLCYVISFLACVRSQIRFQHLHGIWDSGYWQPLFRHDYKLYIFCSSQRKYSSILDIYQHVLSSSLQLHFRRSRPPVLFASVSRLKVLAGLLIESLDGGIRCHKSSL